MTGNRRNVPMRFKIAILTLSVITIAAGVEFEGLFPGGLDHPAIQYGRRPAQNAVAELNSKIQAGKLRLTFEGTPGYLRSTLEALNIPIESQLVVFSKTSLYQAMINPKHPRSIFFNDTIAAGWVPGEPFVELAVAEPGEGVFFYTLEQKQTDKPVFVRQDTCLQCHESYSSLGVPGTLVRSVFPSITGTPLRQLGDFISDHRRPFDQRWGGWYVTGKTGTLAHLGNVTYDPAQSGSAAKGPDLDTLTGKFDTSSYLSPLSDVVALMVFEHQMRMTNLLTRAGWEVRFASYERRPDLASVIRGAANELVDYVFFVDEAPLAGEIRGNSGFAEKFASQEPRDAKDRSLRQFDLKRRLMRYPCSYMIYTEAFNALPAELKAAVYRRMWAILSGAETDAKYARLTHADRKAVVEILRETLTDAPSYFQPVRQH